MRCVASVLAVKQDRHESVGLFAAKADEPAAEGAFLVLVALDADADQPVADRSAPTSDGQCPFGSDGRSARGDGLLARGRSRIEA